MRRGVATVGAAVALAACGPAAPAGLEVADGWTVEVVRDDLAGPTQLVADPADADTVWLAELAGGEDAGSGRVRRRTLTRSRRQ